MSTQSTLILEPEALADLRTLPIPRSAPSDSRLKEIISEGLPTLHNYVFELDALLREDPVDLKAVAWLIGGDPCLSAQVLRICRALPFAKPVLSIEGAVAMAGKERLQAMALTYPLFLTPETPGRNARQTQHLLYAFWQHSPWTALLSKRLAEWTAYSDPDKAYLAGLLHDIGKVPLMLEGVFADYGGDGGDHHIAIGRLLATAWNFPPELIESLESHHRPRQAHLDPALTGIVALADQYGERCGLGIGLEEPRLSPPLTAEIVELAQDCLPLLSRDDTARIAEALESNLLAMSVALGQRLSSYAIRRKRL